MSLRGEDNTLALDKAKLRMTGLYSSGKAESTVKGIENLMINPFSFAAICQISIKKNRIKVEKLPPILMEPSLF